MLKWNIPHFLILLVHHQSSGTRQIFSESEHLCKLQTFDRTFNKCPRHNMRRVENREQGRGMIGRIQ